MKRVVLRKVGDYSHVIGKVPQPTEFGQLVTNDTIFYSEDGEPVGAYVILPESKVKDMRTICFHTKIASTARAHKGLPTQSSVFGAVPRTAIRQDYCRFTQNSLSETENFAIVREFGKYAASVHRALFPENYAESLKLAAEIEPDWLMPATPYATCNFNFNHAIKHHRDAGNLPTAFSNVLILREGVLGGQLVMPEYGVALAQQDRAFTIFRGYKEVHGVMPIKKVKPEGYRASIVYYTLAGMKHCYPFQEEIERVRLKRLEREQRRAAGVDPREV